MTDDRVALAELLEKESDSDLLREMIGNVPPAELELAYYRQHDEWALAA